MSDRAFAFLCVLFLLWELFVISFWQELIKSF